MLLSEKCACDILANARSDQSDLSTKFVLDFIN